ncbi:MAG: mandelate racemase/muconate lactonizing enzyme family protein [Christensenellales bacterium]
MKITDVRVYALRSTNNDPIYYSMGYVTHRSAVIAEVHTDEGIVGYGESLCHGQQLPQPTASMIYHYYRPEILGKDPFDTEVIWETMYNKTRPFGQGGIAVHALSAIDIALWDIKGKALGKPIYKLLGGAYRDTVEPYVTAFHRRDNNVYPDCLYAEADRLLKEGFRSLKMKAGFGVDVDAEHIRMVAEYIPKDVKLMVDFNSCYNVATARRLIYKTEDLENIFWYEELLTPEDVQGYAQLRNISPILIAGGEQTFTKIGYIPFFEKGAYDIIQPDLCGSGGYTEMKKIAAMAQAYNTMLHPHVFSSGIGQAASLQFIANISPAPISMMPTEPYMEFDHLKHAFRGDIVFGEIQLVNGRVPIPQGPGIGVEVNKEVLRKYAVEIFE